MPEEEEEPVCEPTREPESIRARRMTEEGEEEFRIRWKGCTWEKDTWEPAAKLQLPEALRADFEARERRLESAARKKSAPSGKKADDAEATKRKARSLVKS